MTERIKKTFFIENNNDASILYGNHDRYLRLIRNELEVNIIARNGTVKLEGPKDSVETAYDLFDHLSNIIKSTGKLHEKDVNNALQNRSENKSLDNDVILDSTVVKEDSAKEDEPFWDINDLPDKPNILNNKGKKFNSSKAGELHTNLIDEEKAEKLKIDVFFKGTLIKPLTQGQCRYVESIKENSVVFCTGPAGSGKTYLAVALALSALKNGIVEKIVLARPAVEAGERLGFLPGDIHAKINPYLRPLYDALGDMMDTAQVKKYIENDLIEILPLAFMRGRTLNNSFIILDEAQNSTTKQMKTFLTRLGLNSRIVVSGDVTQIDLPANEVSGLIDAQKKLRNIKNIGFVELKSIDVIRNKLIQAIVGAYEKENKDK